MALAQNEVTDYVREMLGEGNIKVELTPSQASRILKQSLRIFNTYRPHIFIEELATQAGGPNPNQQTRGVTRYDLTELDKPFGKGVVEVQRPLGPQAIEFEPDIFALPFQFFYATGGGAGGIGLREVGDVLARQIDIENRRSVVGGVRDWDFRLERVANDNELHGVLYVNPVPAGGERYTYFYAADRTIAEVPNDDEQWFLDYALALGKQVVGRTRRKWNSDLPQDGAALVTEGTTEKKELEAQIKSRAFVDFAIPRQLS